MVVKVLDLCSGTNSISAACAEHGIDADVRTLDLNAALQPTYVADILLWQYVCKDVLEGWKPDLVWASPPCTDYSTLQNLNSNPLLRDLTHADSVVQACCNVIATLQPRFYVIENPGTGLLKTRPFMKDRRDKITVDYCMYGLPYRKRTSLWTNVSFRHRLCNKRCSGYDGSRHQDFRRNGVPERGAVPSQLLKVILDSVLAGRKRPGLNSYSCRDAAATCKNGPTFEQNVDHLC